MAPKDKVGQLKKVKCTYPWCNKHFDTEKEMKHHKRDDPAHFYCKRCNVDCEDWEDLKAHKVAAMAPWVEGQKKGNKDESPMHIVCEFCGMDFDSFGGRKTHRRQVHRADQKIVCPRCKTIFTRGASYLAHFEQNRCSSINSRQFLDYVQHKHVQGQIMAIRDNIQQNVESYEEHSGLIEDGNQDTEEGGIDLLGQDDADQQAGIGALEPERNMIEMHPQTQNRHDSAQEWPQLPQYDEPQLVTSTRKLSLTSIAAELESELMPSASEWVSQITSRGGGVKVCPEFWPSLKSPDMSGYMSDTDATASVASTAVASLSNASGAWSTGNSSTVLFKDVKPTPLPANYAAMLQRRQEEAKAHPQNDMRRARFWDPSWQGFDISMFRGYDEEKMILGFECPFPDCKSFYTASIDLEEHLKLSHTRTKFSCPLCLKRFKTPSALLSHSESPGCNVEKSPKYPALLHELSGGLLTMEQLSEPKIAKDTEGEKKGIMTTRFTAQEPKEDIRW